MLVSKLYKGFKFLLRSIILLIAIVITLITGGIFYCYINFTPEAILEKLIYLDLRITGIENPRIRVAKKVKNQFIAEDIDLGDPQHFAIKKLEILYKFNSKLDLTVNKINIDGLILEDIDLNDNKLTFGNIDKLFAPSRFKYLSQFILSKIKIENVKINDAHFLVDIQNQKLKFPFNSDINMQNKTMLLKANKIVADLNNVKLGSYGQISLNSRISVEFPINWQSGEFNIKKGKIISDSPGKIQYFAQEASTEVSKKLLTGLFENLEYKKINANLEVGTDKKLNIDFHINGRNPTFYYGKEVSLTVNLSVGLSEVIKSLLEAYVPYLEL